MPLAPSRSPAPLFNPFPRRIPSRRVLLSSSRMVEISPMSSPSEASDTIIEYDHETHYAAIEEICKNVYGGTDYLPRLIGKWQGEGDKVLVIRSHADTAQSEASPSPACHAVICARRHGNAHWVYGLRTHEQARGRGLAQKLLSTLQLRLMMDDDDTAVNAANRAAVLLSATIQVNTPMRKVFNKLGWKNTHRIFVWPPWEQTYNLDKLNDGSRTDSHKATLTSAYAPAAALLASTQAADSPLRTETATSIDQVFTAAQHILDVSGGDERTLFLPFEYKVYPIRCAFVQGLIEAGNCQIYYEPSTGAPVAVTAYYASEEMRERTCVGILTGSDSGRHVEAVFRYILQRHPRPVCFVYSQRSSIIAAEDDRHDQMFEKRACDVFGQMDDFLLYSAVQ